ncbi:MAG: hypothetical protein HQ581_23180 [Planctomycetes bacterium]|nr:hypothetical protein [Planctomycetota bacterium]
MMGVNLVFDERLEQLRKQLRELSSECLELPQCVPLGEPAAAFFSPQRCQSMERIARKALWLGVLMIHQKRQGHIASTASALHIMAAIYFSRGYDFVSYARGQTRELVHQCESHKPHAVPGWDGLLYLEGILSKEQVRAFRTFQGPNAYPTHADPGIQIPTGSLGMGPGAAVGLAFVDQFNADHEATSSRGLQISIIGDSEFDEGVIHESIKERATRRITGWIDFIDYNRQSLDGNLDERLVDRIAALYDAFGIPVIILKYGSKLQEVFRTGEAGREVRRRIDALSTEDYHALLRQPGGVIRRVMTLARPDFEAFVHEATRRVDGFLAEIDARGGRPDTGIERLFAENSDRQFKETFGNLGGHDLPMLVSAIEKVKGEGGCAAIIAYTAKGWGMDSLVGSLSGHWSMLSEAQLHEFRDWLGPQIVRPDREWERFAEDDPAGQLLGEIARARKQYAAALEQQREHTRRNRRGALSGSEGACLVPPELPQPEGFRADRPISTQSYLGRLLGRLSSVGAGSPLAALTDRIVTMAADVAYTAGLKDWINARGVWGPPAAVDVVRKYGDMPEMNVQPRHDGQHIRLSNLEQFMGLLAAAFGKSEDLMGVRRFPIAFFYDVFLERFAEMFKYAGYWDSAVWFVGTIAGASAPGESGLHHGAASGIIGRITPNVVTWEPTFPLELNWILAEEFRRAVCGEDEGRRVRYLRTAATPVTQDLMTEHLVAQRRFQGMSPAAVAEAIRPDVLAGGYRLIDHRSHEGYQPGKNVVNLFATGVSVLEAIETSGRLITDDMFANVTVVTSPDLLIDHPDNPQLEALVPAEDRAALVPVLTVTDSHPSYLQGIGCRLAGSRGQPREAALGVCVFDRSGTPAEIKAHHQIDAEAIVREAKRLLGEGKVGRKRCQEPFSD